MAQESLRQVLFGRITDWIESTYGTDVFIGNNEE